MNTFTRKALYAAIAGVAAVGVASTAEAVNISADGLGQVLIYPYYTVRNNAAGQPYNTLVVGRQHDRQRQGRQGPLPRGPQQRGSARLQRFPVPVRRLDGHDHADIRRTGGGPDLDQRQVVHDSVVHAERARSVPYRLSITDADNAAYAHRGRLFRNLRNGDGNRHDGRQGNPRFGRSPHAGSPTRARLADQAPPTGGLFGGVIIVNPAGGGAFSQAATALDELQPATASYQNTGTLSPQYADAAPRQQRDRRRHAVLGRSGPTATTRSPQCCWATRSRTNTSSTPARSRKRRGSSRCRRSTPTSTPACRSRRSPATYVTGVGACEPTFAVVFNREEASPQIVTTHRLLAASPGRAWTDDLLRSHLRELQRREHLRLDQHQER